MFGRAIRTIAISGVVVRSRYFRPHWGAHEKTLAARDIIHQSGLAALYLTEVFKDAINCREVTVDSKDINWGETARVRETGDDGFLQVETMPFILGIGQSLWLL